MKAAYMTRLSRAARWYLPRQEAEDVLADYRDLAGDPPRPDAELFRNLGRPRDAVRLLASPRAYRLWLAAFALLSACALLPLLACLRFLPIWRHDLRKEWFALAFALGLVLSLVWFRQRGEAKTPLPRPIFPALLLLLLGGAAVWWFLRQLAIFPAGALSSGPQGGLTLFGLTITAPDQAGAAAHSALLVLLSACAVAGIAALILARLQDRRWTAVYVLTLTLAMLSFYTLTILTDMSSDLFYSLDSWWNTHLTRLLAVSAVGFVGTGVALC